MTNTTKQTVIGFVATVESSGITIDKAIPVWSTLKARKSIVDRDYDDDYDDKSHGYDCDCDCEECTYEYHCGECGRLPDHLGGGCTLAGTE